MYIPYAGLNGIYEYSQASLSGHSFFYSMDDGFLGPLFLMPEKIKIKMGFCTMSGKLQLVGNKNKNKKQLKKKILSEKIKK